MISSLLATIRRTLTPETCSTSCDDKWSNIATAKVSNRFSEVNISSITICIAYKSQYTKFLAATNSGDKNTNKHISHFTSNNNSKWLMNFAKSTSWIGHRRHDAPQPTCERAKSVQDEKLRMNFGVKTSDIFVVSFPLWRISWSAAVKFRPGKLSLKSSRHKYAKTKSKFQNTTGRRRTKNVNENCLPSNSVDVVVVIKSSSVQCQLFRLTGRDVHFSFTHVHFNLCHYS